ncbi:hypothetical protein TURU_123743 [Turdus rufiventris]|nr:hypothetical protein TURU_123743 [Turdus rufiventris]
MCSPSAGSRQDGEMGREELPEIQQRGGTESGDHGMCKECGNHNLSKRGSELRGTASPWGDSCDRGSVVDAQREGVHWAVADPGPEAKE